MADTKRPFDEPSEVDAVEGSVTLEGPNAVDVAMTPEAAEETSEPLTDRAVKARGQRRLGKLPHQPKDYPGGGAAGAFLWCGSQFSRRRRSIRATSRGPCQSSQSRPSIMSFATSIAASAPSASIHSADATFLTPSRPYSL